MTDILLLAYWWSTINLFKFISAIVNLSIHFISDAVWQLMCSLMNEWMNDLRWLRLFDDRCCRASRWRGKVRNSISPSREYPWVNATHLVAMTTGCWCWKRSRQCFPTLHLFYFMHRILHDCTDVNLSKQVTVAMLEVYAMLQQRTRACQLCVKLYIRRSTEQVYG